VVLAIVFWVVVRGLIGMTHRIRRLDREKIIAEVNTKVSKAARSAEAANVKYKPAIESGMTTIRGRVMPYLDFSGRATRKQFLVTQVAAGLGLGIVLGLTEGLFESRGMFSQSFGIFLIVVASVLVLWVVFATSAKRMRDTGVTDWWVLALLVPALNLAAFAFLCLVPSDEFKGRGL